MVFQQVSHCLTYGFRLDVVGYPFYNLLLAGFDLVLLPDFIYIDE